MLDGRGEAVELEAVLGVVDAGGDVETERKRQLALGMGRSAGQPGHDNDGEPDHRAADAHPGQPPGDPSG